MNRAWGRYVWYIFLFFSEPGPGDINLCRGKRSWSSDVWAGYVPSRAVDGGYNPVLGGNTCMMTGNTNYAWFAVDLEKSYQINRVVVTMPSTNRE